MTENRLKSLKTLHGMLHDIKPNMAIPIQEARDMAVKIGGPGMRDVATGCQKLLDNLDLNDIHWAIQSVESEITKCVLEEDS